MTKSQRKDRAAIARATRICADIYGVFRPLVFLPNKGDKNVVLTRQLAQYIAHCSGQVQITDLARHFKRSTSSVTHSVRFVEDMRDDPEFDAFVTTLEDQFNATE